MVGWYYSIILPNVAKIGIKSWNILEWRLNDGLKTFMVKKREKL